MSKQEWNGEGLPPVGALVDYKGEKDRAWSPCRVVFSSSYYVVVESEGVPGELIDSTGAQISVDVCGLDGPLSDIVRPVRSAEEKAVEAMAQAGQCSYANEERAARVASGIYRAIRDGRIPGVKLDQ